MVSIWLSASVVFESSCKDSLMLITDSGVTSKHCARPLPEVASKGLTTASKEGTIDELDRRHAGRDQENAASANLPSSSSSSTSASVAQASSYRPHAIVVNVVQVNTDYTVATCIMVELFLYCLCSYD